MIDNQFTSESWVTLVPLIEGVCLAAERCDAAFLVEEFQFAAELRIIAPLSAIEAVHEVVVVN